MAEAHQTACIWRRAIAAVAAELDVPRKSVADVRRYREQPKCVARARRTAVYLTVVAHDVSLGAAARVAGLTKEGVRKALHAVEDMRDDPQFDGVVAKLEKEIARA